MDSSKFFKFRFVVLFRVWEGLGGGGYGVGGGDFVFVFVLVLLCVVILWLYSRYGVCFVIY